MTGRWTRN